MKKLNLYISILSIILFTSISIGAKAQDNNDYRVFKFNKGDKVLTIVSGEQLQLKMEDPYSGDNALAQYFIVRKLENNNVIIAAAEKPELTLKRGSGDEVSFEKYNKEDSASFEWRIDYAGFPFCSFSSPDNPMSVVAIDDAGTLKIIQATALENNNSSENFRFGLEKSSLPIF
ncbi:MAG: hypothetical protein ACEPOW_10205 [Bacteroidales bacterium]